jgi:hypothetical protein
LSRAGGEAQAERPHARPHSEKKKWFLYLCFWTLGLGLLLGLLLNSSIRAPHDGALIIRQRAAIRPGCVGPWDPKASVARPLPASFAGGGRA